MLYTLKPKNIILNIVAYYSDNEDVLKCKTKLLNWVYRLID